MDYSSTVGAVSPVAGVGSQAGNQDATDRPPTASPELAAKFEALMARAQPSSSDGTDSVVPASVVAKVDGHLQKYTEVLDNVLKVSEGQMNLVDLQALTVRNITQVGVMSMTHTAYTQVLGSAKGSVSALIKNQ